MKESYEENLASDFGPDPYAGGGNTPGVASARGNAGQPLSSEIITSVCRLCVVKGKAISLGALRQACGGHGGVLDPVHTWTFQAREPGDPAGLHAAMGAPVPAAWSGQPNVYDGKAA